MESPFKADVLKGMVALLTGGGSGIGFEISTQFGKHGASIAIMGRRKNVLDNAVSVLQSLGIPAVGFEGDVRKREDAQRVVEATVRHFGKLDILVNAAAGNFLVSAEDLSPNGFKTGLALGSSRKYVNGSILPVDGGLWLSKPRHLSKDAVKQLSRTVEKRSRAAPAGVPTSKL
ncbi:2,4-dienoyl-CoA reductase (NADPH) [Handroanthus impetiginosus]|uniref:2,4-dienoyl-CoA reductase [(3E)-enoyl-CoA-producing] n=1 Tax=Handroanthus impetiginosus TaxID=429701 RepID=A0A2G9GI36_9LAMI|nr:2,4-dienoyl-CoA reductase (NADPH) [Handroanthus impetiginosus]